MGHIYRYKPQTAPGEKVFIATPSLSGATSPGYQLSLLRSIEAAAKHGISVYWCMLAYNCHVDDSRNFLVREFLESDCDYIFWIDSDVAWKEDDFVRLLLSGKDMAAGVYPKKTDNDDEWPVAFIKGPLWTDDDGWLEVAGVPAGFLCMTRSCVKALYDAEPKKFRKAQEKNRIKQAIVFERTLEDGARTGGDYAMCNKWRRMGGQVFIDPEMRFGHEGTKEWRGRLSYHLQAKNGLLEARIIESLRQIERGDYNEETLVQLSESWANGKWTASTKLLSSTALLLDKGQYNNVLELGAGLSTLVLAAIGKRKGFSVESVEQDKQWFAIVKRYLDKLGYDVNLVYAPLESGWYDYTPDRQFDLVFCDGPIRIGQARGIRENITRIADAFTNDCVLIVDDFNSDFAAVLNEFEFSQYHTFAVGRRQ